MKINTEMIKEVVILIRKGKLFLAIGVMTLILAAAFSLPFIGKTPKKSGNINADKNINREYAILSVSKKEFKKMSKREFIDKITSVLDAYKDKLYTTFDFGDGTGIYFPFSDITKGGQYGEIDKKGIILHRIGDITIKENDVIYQKTLKMSSKESMALYKYIPSEFVTDDFGLCLIKDNLFIMIPCPDVIPESEAKNIVIDFLSKAKDKGLNISKFNTLKISTGLFYGYKVDTKTSNITHDDDVIDDINESFKK